MRLPAILALVLTLFSLALPVRAAETHISVNRTSESLTDMLPIDRPIYLKVVYTTDQPLRIQAAAFLDGQPVEAGEMMNASVLHPAGKGRALAWVSFRQPAAIDEIRVTAYDAEWRALAVRSLETSLSWAGEPGAAKAPVPDWTEKLLVAERKIAADEAVEQAGGAGFMGLIVGLIIMSGVPAYFICQYLMTRNLVGRWRLASLAPLALMVPLIAHALFALAAGSNIWSMFVVLYAPVACAYLFGLYAARSMTRVAPAE